MRFEPPVERAADPGERAERVVGAVRSTPPRPASRASSDPFFDRPYESAAVTGSDPAAWDRKPASMAVVPSRAPNIRTKRKVASLLGGSNQA